MAIMAREASRLPTPPCARTAVELQRQQPAVVLGSAAGPRRKLGLEHEPLGAGAPQGRAAALHVHLRRAGAVREVSGVRVRRGQGRHRAGLL